MRKISELERIKKRFLNQAKTFRALAKMISKDPTKTEMNAKVCEGMAEISELMAEIIVLEESERDHQN